MSDRTRRLVILAVTATAFLGLLVGWAIGLVGNGPVGRTATTGFAVLALFFMVLLTALFFSSRGDSGESN